MEEESCCVPPGFRFHPTEEELVGYYLARKVASQKIDLDIIQEVDLYRIEPWDLQERCKQGVTGGEEQTTEWYFFSYKDRKYPSGTRTNRATAAGFWKATGRDKPVLSSSSGGGCSSRVVIGMRKTLVFYKGRAPNGRKTDWIMHEYRIQSNEHAPPQEEGWVVCRAFQKPVPNQRPCLYPTPGYYDNILGGSSYYSAAGAGAADAAVGNIFRPQQLPNFAVVDDDLFESKKHHLFSIPPLQSPTAISDGYQLTQRCNTVGADDHELLMIHQHGGQPAAAIDWNFLDSLLQSTASQLHDPTSSLPRADY